MKALSLPAVLITDPANVFYFSGFTGCSGDGILLITMDHLWILTDSRYTLQVEAQCQSYEILGNSSADIVAIGTYLQRIGIDKIGFENDKITYAFWHRFNVKYPHIVLCPLEDMLIRLRDIKDPEECRLIAKACDIAVDALKETLPYIRSGISEGDIALELEYRLRKKGASGTSFETIVASGERSALPHGVATNRILQKGDAVTVDFGAVYKGYCSDMTRTFFIGDPSDELRKIYNAVYTSQMTAIQSFEPGMSSCELDQIARNVLKQAGYGEYFVHSLGHGVGIEVHEGITIGRKKPSLIQPGMVFSIEPGVYISGIGGVRIEDLVVCTETGLLNLTAGFEKELAILE